MKIHYIMIALIIVGMVATGVTLYIGELGTSYGLTADMTGLNRTMTQLSNTQNDAKNITDTLHTFQLRGDILDVIYVPYEMIKIGWTVTKTIFGSFGVVGALISDISTSLAVQGVPIPPWVTTSIISIFFITISAIIIYAFFKWKMED